MRVIYSTQYGTMAKSPALWGRRICYRQGGVTFDSDGNVIESAESMFLYARD